MQNSIGCLTRSSKQMKPGNNMRLGCRPITMHTNGAQKLIKIFQSKANIFIRHTTQNGFAFSIRGKMCKSTRKRWHSRAHSRDRKRHTMRIVKRLAYSIWNCMAMFYILFMIEIYSCECTPKHTHSGDNFLVLQSCYETRAPALSHRSPSLA